MASKICRPFARRFSSAPKIPGHHGENAEAGEKLWEKITYFVAIPACILGAANVLMHEHKHERPQFVPYEHLRIVRKKFPWGDGNRTLFFNPKVNPLPTGYID